MKCKEIVMRTKSIASFLLVWLSLNTALLAVDGNVKVFFKPYGDLYTSQKATLAVELMSDAFSITDVKIGLHSTSEYLVEAPQSAAFLQQVDVNGSDWQMVHYEYGIYALHAGEIELPAFEISFSASMGYGQPKKTFVLHAPPQTLHVKTPKGIDKNHFVLVTERYTITDSFKPDTKTLTVGDAIEVEIMQKAQGVPDILFCPVHYASNAKMRVYEKEPILQSGMKGDFDVARMDRFTLVATSEGNVTLPERRFRWWNPKTQHVHTEILPKRHFVIKPNPQIALDAQKKKRQKILLVLIGALALLVLLYYLFASRIRAWMQKRKEAYERSESGRFEALTKSVQTSSVAEIYTYFYIWLHTIQGGRRFESFSDIMREYPEFEASLRDFEAALLGEKEIDRESCRHFLKALRERLLRQNIDKKYGLPKHLNP